jgi:hypothetical protein
MMLRAGEGDDERGKAVERPPDHVGFTDGVVQVRIVPHDLQGNRGRYRQAYYQCTPGTSRTSRLTGPGIRTRATAARAGGLG